MPKRPPDTSTIPLTSVPPSGAAASTSSFQGSHDKSQHGVATIAEGSTRESSSDLEHLSKEVGRQGTPFAEVSHPDTYKHKDRGGSSREVSGEEDGEEGSGVVVWDADH